MQTGRWRGVRDTAVTSMNLPKIEIPAKAIKTNGGISGTRFTNWAQTFQCYPELFFKPEDEQEVRQVIALARANSKHLTVVGAGHSPGDNVCTTDYMMSLDNLNKVISVDHKSRQITVQAGIRLYDLHRTLEDHGLAMPNLGSISDQSLAGAIATATHGSSLQHQILSSQVVELKIILADGTDRICSASRDTDLFRAALVSLGALGVIVQATVQVSDAFDIQASQHILDFDHMLNLWEADKLWQQAEFVRIWWFPYSGKTILWKGERVEAGRYATKSPKSWFRGMFWAYHVQQALLYLGRFAPSYGPAIERLVFQNQYGWKEGQISDSVEKSFVALNMNCLFSQYVNEWSIPLEKGVEACKRLQYWLNGEEEKSGIPYSSAGINVHAPIELRVAKSSDMDAWLSTAYNGPYCYIGVIMYKPYFAPVPYRRYFQAYEYLMKELGGRPHWAKQHNMTKAQLVDRYPKLNDWLTLRQQVDPTDMFVTEYHRRHLLNSYPDEEVGVLEGSRGRRFKALTSVL